MAKPINPDAIPGPSGGRGRPPVWLPLLDAFLASGDAAWELEPADLLGVEPQAAATRLGNAARESRRPVRAAKRGERIFLVRGKSRRRKRRST